jgi:hypothetical protein
MWITMTPRLFTKPSKRSREENARSVYMNIEVNNCYCAKEGKAVGAF